MNKHVVGNTKSLKTAEKKDLDKLVAKRSGQKDIASPELVKRACEVSWKIGRQIGMLIGRDGRIEYLVIGTKDRMYLPDLGRFRLASGRLRRLRLVVCLPGEEKYLSAKSDQNSNVIFHPPSDFVTDLEKLRLDCLLAVGIKGNGEVGRACFMHLQPSYSKNTKRRVETVEQQVKNIYDLEINFQEFISDLDTDFSALWDKTIATQADAAVLLGVHTGDEKKSEQSMEELQELARSAGVTIVDQIVQKRRKLDPRTVFGSGKLEEIVLQCLDLGADLVIFDRELSPSQLRQITALTELRILDRSMLILDIFAQRAKSSEGRLQVELAQLKYSLPRLTEQDSGLSRLAGGIGGRGPGETKLEISRRRARERISDLEKKIGQVSERRSLRRARRQERGVPVVSIVGYTNAGKSTLLNSLTKGDVFAEDKLFATLDPSSRRMRFPNDKEIVFVDTVGFIRELPEELINAFQATLEEVIEADLLIHVVDVSNEEFVWQIEVVEQTLKDIGAGDKPQILLLHKVDLLSTLEIQMLKKSFGGIPVSSTKRIGFPELIEEIREKLGEIFDGQDPGGFIFSQENFIKE